MWAGVCSPPRSVLPLISQARITAEFVESCGGLLCAEDVPFLEDIMNSSELTDFIRRRNDDGDDALALAPPSYAVNEMKAKAMVAAGRQCGVRTSKLALDPLVAVDDDKASHLAKALELADTTRVPWAGANPVDKDMNWAIERIIENVNDLRRFRERILARLAELKERVMPITKALIAQQPRSVHLAASQIDVGFLAALIILIRWPDKKIVHEFVVGFRAVGEMANSSVLRPGGTPALGTVGEMKVSASSKAKLNPCAGRQFEPEDSAFILEAVKKLQDKGIASEMMDATEMDAAFGKDGWMYAPSFVHVQSSGKRRLISNAKPYQNRSTDMAETVGLCTAVNPGLVSRAFVEKADEMGVSTAGWALESGGEDMPDAYLVCPVTPEDLSSNVVEVPPGVGAAWRRFVVAFAMLFGFRSSVSNFTRFSVLFEAVARRIVALALSMFYDDASLQDLAQARGSGQASLVKLIKMIGGSFKPEKEQKMNSKSDFLGLIHDLSGVFSDNTATFEPRESLVEKAASMVSVALESDELRPSVAGKLLGLRAFLESGMFSRIGKVGQRALIKRTYFDTERAKGGAWPLSLGVGDEALRNALIMTNLMLWESPKRTLELKPARRKPILIASDAQASVKSVSAAFLAIDLETNRRWGKCWKFEADDLEALGFPGYPLADETRNPISAAEAAAVAMSYVLLAEDDSSTLAERDVVHWIDNTAALHSLVKGGQKKNKKYI